MTLPTQPARFPRRSLLAALSAAVALAAFTGCIAKKPDAPAAGPPPLHEPLPKTPIPTDPDTPPDAEQRLSRLYVEFSVHRCSAPRGVFSAANAPIWKIASLPLPTAAMTLHLTDSGFRAAIGRESDRKPLAEALDALRESVDLRCAFDQVIPDASRAIEMEIGRASTPLLTVFYAAGGGRLEGKDFADASLKFIVSFAVRVENLNEVWVKMTPLIEEPPGLPRWVGEPGGGFRQVAEPRRTLFEDVSLTAAVPEGGFILFGPTSRVYDRPYLARPFFVEKKPVAGKNAADPPAFEERESIYIISPVIRKTPASSISR